MLMLLRSYNIKPIIVLDGTSFPAKAQEDKARKEYDLYEVP
jgi:hypothetical protein